MPFLYIFIVLYGIFCLLLAYKWLSWAPYKPKKEQVFNKKISLIIPVRNEAKNILNLLNDLENQSLPYSFFEVIIANDDSSDNTEKLIIDFQKHSALPLKLINLPHKTENSSPKKRAISHCIPLSSGQIIVTTDGDCRLNANWLFSLLSYFTEFDPVFLSAPVYFSDEHKGGFLQKLWNKIQKIEFASLIISGAVSMKLGWPNMCSGANMAYLKSAFNAVEGFKGNEHLASGDDEFLMHKMNAKFGNRVHYLKSKEAAVLTASLPNWKSFYQQRKRWAGKWTHYESLSPKLTAIFIFLSNALSVYAFLSGNILLLSLKLLPEFLFLFVAVKFFGKRTLLPFLIPFVQLIYPFYVLLFGLNSFDKKAYVWKNRELK